MNWIGLVLGLYMVGMAAAAWRAQLKILSGFSKKMLNIYIILLILFAMAFWPVIRIVQILYSPLIFLIIVFIAGALTGGLFPILCAGFGPVNIKKEGGLVYAADVTGGAAGAVCVSGLLVPLFGFINTLILLVIGGIVSLGISLSLHD